MFKVTKRILIVVAVIAAVSAPSTAYARFDLNPSPRGVAIGQARGQSAGRVVAPNPDEQGTQSGSVGPPILPVARAAELAAINRGEERLEAARSYSLPQGAPYSNAPYNAYAALAHPVAASSPNAPYDGFDYGAAAIGAGLAVMIIVVITVGGLVVRRRRRPQYG